MKNQKAKAEAEKIIEMFTQEVTILGCGKGEGNSCVVSDTICYKDARLFSIIHVKGIINVVDGLVNDCDDIDWSIINSESDKWQSILTELERK